MRSNGTPRAGLVLDGARDLDALARLARPRHQPHTRRRAALGGARVARRDARCRARERTAWPATSPRSGSRAERARRAARCAASSPAGAVASTSGARRDERSDERLLGAATADRHVEQQQRHGRRAAAHRHCARTARAAAMTRPPDPRGRRAPAPPRRASASRARSGPPRGSRRSAAASTPFMASSPSVRATAGGKPGRSATGPKYVEGIRGREPVHGPRRHRDEAQVGDRRGRVACAGRAPPAARPDGRAWCAPRRSARPTRRASRRTRSSHASQARRDHHDLGIGAASSIEPGRGRAPGATPRVAGHAGAAPAPPSRPLSPTRRARRKRRRWLRRIGAATRRRMRVVSLLPAATEIVAALGLMDAPGRREPRMRLPGDGERPAPRHPLRDPRQRAAERRDRSLGEDRARTQRHALHHGRAAAAARWRPTSSSPSACATCAPSARDSVTAFAATLPGPPAVVNLEPQTLADVFGDIRRVARRWA